MREPLGTWLGTRGERWALAQFVLSGLAAVALVLILGLVAFNRAGRDEAVKNAVEVTRIGATGVVAPGLDDAVLTGDRAALARLDARVRASLLEEPVLRIVVSRADGTVVYSSEPGATGRREPLSPEARAALRTGTAQSRTGGPRDPAGDLPEDTQLLDVSQPVTTPGGERLVVQSCRRLASVRAAGRRLLDHFAPFLIGGVLLLQLVNTPLALALVRRVRRVRRHEEQMLQRELDASDRERRRLATDLHNGVIQELAGMSMSLAAAQHTAAARGEAETAAQLTLVAADSRRTTRTLRHVLVDIYPPNLQKAGLRSALEDLLETARRRLVVQTRLDEDLDALSSATAALVFRVAQEAVRNVVAHAGAAVLEVRLEVGEDVLLHVADDGRGFEPGAPVAEGHLGLALMRDLVEQAGGELAVASAPRAGTVVRARVPRA